MFVLLVGGTLATLASARVGLMALDRLLRVDELEGSSGPRRRCVDSLRGPLLPLAAGQQAEVHYRSQGCFHSLDSIFTFTRNADGLMSVAIVDGSSSVYGDPPPYQRTLMPEEVASIDRQIAAAQSARGVGCTTRQEFDLLIRDPSGEIGRSHFEDASCESVSCHGQLSLAALEHEAFSRRH